MRIYIGTLFLICQILEYNFFAEIAGQLPDKMPKLENEQLKLQVTTLKETFGWGEGDSNLLESNPPTNRG